MPSPILRNLKHTGTSFLHIAPDGLSKRSKHGKQIVLITSQVGV
jgi:hypothetical protein